MTREEAYKLKAPQFICYCHLFYADTKCAACVGKEMFYAGWDAAAKEIADDLKKQSEFNIRMERQAKDPT